MIKNFKVGDIKKTSEEWQSIFPYPKVLDLMDGIERTMITLGKKRKSHLKSMKIG